MDEKLYYTVAEDYQGEIVVASYLGANRAEERRNALTTNRVVHAVLTDYHAAQGMAAELRRNKAVKA